MSEFAYAVDQREARAFEGSDGHIVYEYEAADGLTQIGCAASRAAALARLRTIGVALGSVVYICKRQSCIPPRWWWPVMGCGRVDWGMWLGGINARAHTWIWRLRAWLT